MILGCKQMYRRLFVVVNLFHARHIREYAAYPRDDGRSSFLAADQCIDAY